MPEVEIVTEELPVKHMFIRHKWTNKPLMTVAYIENGDSVDVGFCICHPSDECNKSKGKEISAERARDRERRRVFKRNTETAKQAVLYHILQWGFVPKDCIEDAVYKLTSEIKWSYLGYRNNPDCCHFDFLAGR